MELPDYDKFFKDTPDPTNLLISFSHNTDIEYFQKGHKFLGAGNLKVDGYNGEIHIFLKKGYNLC